MPLHYATYPGLDAILTLDMPFRLGWQPSVAHCEIAEQTADPSPTGNLVLAEDTARVTLRDCAIVSSHVRPWALTRESRGHVQIADRRWKWLYGAIDGSYNRRLADGTVEPSSRKSLRELADLLLQAMGEVNYDLGPLSANVYPPANWLGATPAKMLHAICQLVGCDIALGVDNRVRIVRYGAGATLPTANQMFSYRGVPDRQIPADLGIEGGPVIVQSRILLEAVGRDTDGSIKTIANLSYKPADGWGTEWPLGFPNVTAASRVHALETVFRWFRIARLATTIPGLPFPIADVQQILPLGKSLFDAYTDSDGSRKTLPAYVTGRYWQMGDADDGTDSGVARYPGKFEIDAERGLVKFDEPVTRIVDDAWAEPTLYLVTTHPVAYADGSGYWRFWQSRAGLGGTGTRSDKHLELFYGIDAVNGGNTFISASAEATSYLAHLAASYTLAGPAEQAHYDGFLALSPDGANKCVHWRMPRNDPATTMVGRHLDSAPPSIALDSRQLRHFDVDTRRLA